MIDLSPPDPGETPVSRGVPGIRQALPDPEPMRTHLRAFRPRLVLPALLLVPFWGCGAEDVPQPDAPPQPADVHAAFLANLSEHCGQAFLGQVIHVPEEDPYFTGDPELIMHVRECSPDEVRIPVHLGDDHSRTWIFTRTAGGVDLRHDHRHPDGTPEPNTFYGSFVAEPPLALEPLRRTATSSSGSRSREW
jgi:hypothetical protein